METQLEVRDTFISNISEAKANEIAKKYPEFLSYCQKPALGLNGQRIENLFAVHAPDKTLLSRLKVLRMVGDYWEKTVDDFCKERNITLK